MLAQEAPDLPADLAQPRLVAPHDAHVLRQVPLHSAQVVQDAGQGGAGLLPCRAVRVNACGQSRLNEGGA